jgi:hypothetical protein
MSPFPKGSDFFLPPRNYTGRKQIEIEIEIEIEIKIGLVASGLNSI